MYKTILTHIDQFTDFEPRLRVAAALAEAFQAHLVGGAANGADQMDRLLFGAAALAKLPPAPEPPLQRGAVEQLRRFEQACARLGVASYETRLADGGALESLVLQARYSDLLVTGQADLSEPAMLWSARLPGYLALRSVRPLLVVPQRAGAPIPGRTVVVGWSGSPESSRAVAGALPLLRRADLVKVAVFNPQRDQLMHGAEPGADLAHWLVRHGVKVEVVCRDTSLVAGDALLRLADDSGADLIVAGAYGHTRFHEWVLGSTTGSLLGQDKTAVLLCH
ncbi:universal stress protein [Pseudoduganella namucuonensis]|uniref:Universal stress protein family protein n=1 Tax=Pseudoduganella namucuonensis TaxID=1035707 RepID=A0A1I7KNQ9_9BURK|nr:universal stress protein [Pseudoduganella namucuonensis]SFU99059.1 Universal stress protein family protein [Pseudoduganella namucuonensis]